MNTIIVFTIENIISIKRISIGGYLNDFTFAIVIILKVAKKSDNTPRLR